MKSIFLVVTGPQYVPGHWASSFRRIQLPPGSECAEMYGWYVDFACNQLLRDFLAGPWSHVAFMDTDMIYPEDYLLRLARHDHPIVSGVYRMRFPPYAWGCFDQAGKIVRELPAAPWFSTYSCKGAWLCDREVFEKTIPPPWFVERSENGCDSDFCERVPFKILVDPSVVIEHITTARVTAGGQLVPLPPAAS